MHRGFCVVWQLLLPKQLLTGNMHTVLTLVEDCVMPMASVRHVFAN